MAFLTCYSAIHVIFSSDKVEGIPMEFSCGIFEQIEENFIKLSSLCIINDTFKHIHCSKIASAILLCTRRNLDISPDWPQELVTLTTYEANVLLDLVEQIQSFSDTKRGSSPNSIMTSPCNTASTISQCTSEIENMSLQNNKDREPDSESIDDINTFTKNKIINDADKENTLPSPSSVTNFGVL